MIEKYTVLLLNLDLLDNAGDQLDEDDIKARSRRLAGVATEVWSTYSNIALSEDGEF